MPELNKYVYIVVTVIIYLFTILMLIPSVKQHHLQRIVDAWIRMKELSVASLKWKSSLFYYMQYRCTPSTEDPIQENLDFSF